MKKCPVCGSERVAPIVYGLLRVDEEMKRKIHNEVFFPGGDIVPECAPKFHCFECGRDLGSPPIIIHNGRKEDYRDCVTEILFRYGGYFGGFSEILMKKKLGVTKIPHYWYSKDGNRLKITDKEWNKVLILLYCELYIHEWKEYYENPSIMDGTQWELCIKLTEDRVCKYSGINEYPPCWNELKSIFSLDRMLGIEEKENNRESNTAAVSESEMQKDLKRPQMQYCIKCGAKLNGMEIFCGRCGAFISWPDNITDMKQDDRR